MKQVIVIGVTLKNIKSYSMSSIDYTKRLGIYYTNNDNNLLEPLRKKTLNQLKNISNVDIVCSVWNPIKNNPFPEYIIDYKEHSITNICLQILSLLSLFNDKQKYKYVSFLEHDVLYPKNYFNYPEFDTSFILNTNYLGLNKFGYIEKKDNIDKLKRTFMSEYENSKLVDCPLFCTTMNFNFAIRHFAKILFISLNKDSSPSIEPLDRILNNDYILFEGENPVLHLETGYNFSHHFNIFYDKENVCKNNEYWGPIKNYKKLFKKLRGKNDKNFTC